MRIEEIRRVLVVGAGTMGRQISLLCAMHGYDAALYVRRPHMLDTTIGKVRALALEWMGEGRLTQSESSAALSRITTTSNPGEAAAEVDLLSESVAEDPRIKARVFAQFDRLCPPRTIFTTNTSTLVPSQYAKATGRPAQFCAFHFHQPVLVANVVDIMPHPGTSEETITLLHDFARRIGQIPVFIKKENKGYIFNAMFNAFLRVALILAASKVASVEDIDRAWMGVTKMPIGPFGMIDIVGVDLTYEIAKRQTKWVFFMPQARGILNFLKAYVDQGRLGIKTGKGFYTYPNSAFQQPGFLEGEPFLARGPSS